MGFRSAFVLAVLGLVLRVGTADAITPPERAQERGIRLGVELHTTCIRFNVYASKEKWGQFDVREAAFELKTEKPSVEYAGARLAEDSVGTEYRYSFNVPHKYARDVGFSLRATGRSRIGVWMKLRDYLIPEDLISVDIRLPKKTVRVGEQFDILIDVVAKREVMISFPSSCQFWYKIFAENLTEIVENPPCSSTFTELRLKPGEKKTFRKTAPPRNFVDGKRAPLPPGTHTIEVGISGHRNDQFLPRARAKLEVLPSTSMAIEDTVVRAAPDRRRFYKRRDVDPAEELAGPNRELIAYVLGTLQGVEERRDGIGSEIVVEFGTRDYERLLIIFPAYRDLAASLGLDTRVRLEMRHDDFVVRSKELADYVEAFYRFHNRGSQVVGRIDDSVFVDVDRDVKLQYVAGAYARSGHGYTLLTRDGSKKILLVQRFLRELDCTILGYKPRIIGSPHGGVMFEPSPEVDAVIAKHRQRSDGWQLGMGVDDIPENWPEFRDESTGYVLNYPKRPSPRASDEGELMYLWSQEDGKLRFTVQQVAPRVGTTVEEVYKRFSVRFQDNASYMPQHTRRGFLGRHTAIEVPMDGFRAGAYILESGGRVYVAEAEYGEYEYYVRMILATIRPLDAGTE